MREISLSNTKKTLKCGQEYAKTLKKGDVICLDGAIGSGKTTFVKGVAQGLGVQDCITSPTFELIHIYQNIPMLYHMDLYRLSSLEEFYLIGGMDYIEGDGICLIEWSNLIQEIRPAHTRFVDFFFARKRSPSGSF